MLYSMKQVFFVYEIEVNTESIFQPTIQAIKTYNYITEEI